MSEASHKELFLKSLNRCSADSSFIPSFYDRFLGRSEEIRHKFRFTDFTKQNEMLLHSLKLAAGATSGEPEALHEIRERAETHDRHHLDIKPELYEYWFDSVIETARQFDPEWNDDVEQSWSTILGYVIRHMAKFY